MRRLVTLLFLFILSYTCFAQNNTMLNSLYRNVQQYQTYATSGPIGRFESSQKKLSQGIGFFNTYLMASFEGSSDTAAAAKAKFDALYGKTHNSLSFTLSLISNPQFDSITFDGSSWTNYIYPKDSIDAWIATATGGYDSTVMATEYDIYYMLQYTDTTSLLATQYDIYNMVENSDTTSTIATRYDIANMIEFPDTSGIVATEYDIVNMVEDSDISDMVEFADTGSIIATQYDLTNVSGGGAATDSSFYSATIYDTLIFQNDGSEQGIYFKIDANGRLRLIDASSLLSYYALEANGIRSNSGSGGLRLDFANEPSTTNPTITLDYDDTNTGYTWVSEGKLGLVGNSNLTFTSEYNSSAGKSINDAKDSLIVTGIDATRGHFDSISVNNSDYHKNLMSFEDVPAENSLRVISPSGAMSYATLELDVIEVFTGSLTDGSPTASEINTILSTSPSTAGSGTRFIIIDSDGTEGVYFIVSNGTTWHYEALTEAL